MKGLKTIASDFSVRETVDRMVEGVEEQGWHVFARIDHATEARDKGLELRPTEVLLFGNPRVGTRLMQDRQSAAIDLPAKALAWQDDEGQVWVTRNTTAWLKERHELTSESRAATETIEDVVTTVCNNAAGKES